MATTALTPAARQLAAVEARRMLRHPVYGVTVLFLAAYGTSTVFEDHGPAVNAAYSVVLLSFLLVYAPATLIAGNRVAAATYRNRVREPLDGTPVDARQRTVAVILGLLRGPVAAGVVTALLLLLLDRFGTAATADPLTAVHHRAAQEYLQLPALTLGAGLLGIAVARWLPRPGALPLVSVAVVLAFLLLFRFTGTAAAPAGAWFTPWPVWTAGTYGLLPRQPLHQEMWHLTYLLGLGTLAGIAAVLRTPGPCRVLYAAGAAAVVVTALAAVRQLG